jgi:hypothetical protein
MQFTTGINNEKKEKQLIPHKIDKELKNQKITIKIKPR